MYLASCFYRKVDFCRLYLFIIPYFLYGLSKRRRREPGSVVDKGANAAYNSFIVTIHEF